MKIKNAVPINICRLCVNSGDVTSRNKLFHGLLLAAALGQIITKRRQIWNRQMTSKRSLHKDASIVGVDGRCHGSPWWEALVMLTIQVLALMAEIRRLRLV